MVLISKWDVKVHFSPDNCQNRNAEIRLESWYDSAEIEMVGISEKSESRGEEREG